MRPNVMRIHSIVALNLFGFKGRMLRAFEIKINSSLNNNQLNLKQSFMRKIQLNHTYGTRLPANVFLKTGLCC